MPIQPFHAAPNTGDAISKALGIVSAVYGIKQAGAAQDMYRAQQANLEQKTANEGKQFDIANKQSEDMANPLSPVSQLARHETLGGLEAYKNSGNLSSERYSAMKTLIEGKPATPETPDQFDDNGDLVAKGQPAQPAIPGLSAAALNKNPELGPLGAFVKGKQSADAMAAAATARAAPQNARLEETKNQNASKSGDSFENDPIIKLSKTNLNSLTRSQSILDNPNKPVLTKDLNLAYNDYINAVAAGGAATEGKIQRELPESFDTNWNDLKAKAGKFDDLRQDPTGAQLISMLKENISTVRGDLSKAVEEQAARRFDDYTANTNPKVQDTVKKKLKTYAPNVYAQKFGGSPDQGGSNAATGGPKVGAIEEGHKFKGGNPADPNNWELVK